MSKQYSEMTNKELVAVITELRADHREAWEKTVRGGGRLIKGGQYDGWWCHIYRSPAVKAAMSNLVEAGHWEWHSQIECYARPVEKDEDNA